ncbi:GNAT family N-acetyltransferase [Virgibacillus sp. NKC19-3]|uniref:GNAT family N-acetyltransferase n=1 Tax=Virgibacillus saliphilus TaxID=2831674 RepID=UPI001C9AD5C9|nr:GNAT family N-acetyltransferase [Virgibacillus sp. NKC19-3]MBY7144426.1 GNAT family N-acetyltransferase [Virgibacillus sp. NKC19-3]
MSEPTEQIVELTEQQQFLKVFPLINQLRTDLTENSFLELLEDMRSDGYKLFSIVKESEFISIAGFVLKVNFYNRKHVFVFDLVTDMQYRSQGYGTKLLNFIDDWAKLHEAKYVALESGIIRTEAHRLYEKELGYDKWCYSFRKKL